MLKQGHFHAHIKSVSRSKGYSAVAAAAYQSGQDLTHQKQHLFSVDLGYDKDRGGVTADHRKKLNKGVITDTLRQEFAAGGITLGAGAAAHKIDRSNWTITDGELTYTVREFRHRVLNRETGKREDAALKLDVYADRRHNYTTREDVKATWVQAPTYAPEWIRAIAQKGGAVEKKDRAALWNWAEAAEVARDARTARTFQVALSRGLSYDQNIGLLRQYVDEQLTPHGFVSDVAIHSKKASDGKDNLHAHILITTRSLKEDGTLSAHKIAPWDDHEKVSDRHKAWGSQLRAWRGAWADKLNDALAEQDSPTRVDHRSYKEQGVDVIPTEHIGAADWNKGQRGQRVEAAERNEAIEQQNAKRDRALRRAAEFMGLRKPGETPEKETVAKPAEKPAAQSEQQYYSGRVTVRRWFGLGSTTTHTFYPGPASLPRKQRDALDKSTPRLTPGEIHERLSAAQDRSLATYILSNQSGGSPAETLERMQRIGKVVRDKAAEARQHLGVYYKSWKDRTTSGGGGQRNQQSERSDRSDRER